VHQSSDQHKISHLGNGKIARMADVGSRFFSYNDQGDIYRETGGTGW
jgi:hypothetical protein